MNLKLVYPTLEMEPLYFDYIDEWKKSGETIVPGFADPSNKDYKTWLYHVLSMQKKETCPSDSVPADSYFMVNESWKIIGSVQIRHMLNDYLFNYGGNIGYGIRPSERRKGFENVILDLALKKCIDLNIRKVLITCDKDNIASAKTIIANGGILENEVPLGGEIKQRYWISL